MSVIKDVMRRVRMMRDIAKIKNLSNTEFIDFAYKVVLGRQADKEGKKHFISMMKRGMEGREDMLLALLTCDEYMTKHASSEFVPSGHFYSAIPSAEDKQRYFSRMRDIPHGDLPGLSLNDHTQYNTMCELKSYYDEHPFSDEKTEGFCYYFNNPAYSYGDALTLYGMIRYVKPERIVEVGSGFSSCVMLDTNDHYFDGKIDLTFVEPYPELLISLLNKTGRKKCKILDSYLQEVDPELFGVLQENDILFIDSTHVAKLGSDVNKIIFEILPSLNKGVVIHIHDVFWPFEYPDEWINEGRAWNEIYMLRAFLEFNDSFEIIFFSPYMCTKHADWIGKNMPLYQKNCGGNIWLRKTK